jgi:dTDP-4-dehydrorhamnose reductase
MVVGATPKGRFIMAIKILVTGASGQLGSEIVAQCDAMNIDVVPMNRSDADITDSKSVDKFILKHEPTHIIHCAAWTAVDMCERDASKALKINSEGTKNIVNAAKMVKAHVTYISTDYVFDGKKESPYVEGDSEKPISIYGMTKLMGERAMRKTDAIVRVSWVCGENGSNVVKTVLKAAAEGSEMSFVDDQLGTPTFADDAAKKIIEISKNKSSGIWHVANSGVTSWYEFVRAILKFGGFSTELVRPITTEQLEPKRPANRPQRSALETTRANNKMDSWLVPLERLVKKLTS